MRAIPITWYPCPKCGVESDHDFHYVPRMGIYSGRDGMPHIGPCMVRTCLICGYSYKEATQDGES
jgi:rubredoxin